MENIAFAKIGKSIKFKTNSYSPTGGDNEAPSILRALANHNPDKKFYLVGRSDFSRLTDQERLDLFHYDNVIDCFKDSGNISDNPYYLVNWLKDNRVTIDFGIMMIGQIASVTVTNRVYQVRDPTKIFTVMAMAKNYVTPTIVWLNEVNPPWIELITDPRYTKAQPKDLLVDPKSSLGQYDYTYEHKRIKSFDDQSMVSTFHDARYAGIETTFCVGRVKPDITKIEKQTHFVVILNEGNPSRFNMLKEWVLDYNKDVEIYGSWNHKETINDNRFKGAIKLDLVQEKVLNSKYTFIIPIKKGWVTSKYIEMIHAGCIPFFHPTYDEQHHIPIPKLLRVKSPQEMYDTINYLENHPEARYKILSELQTLLKDDYYSGKFINDQIMNEAYNQINKDYISPDLLNYEKEELLTLF